MRHFKSFQQHVNESAAPADHALVLPVGHALFHSTTADFDLGALRGGGYDSMVWTAEESGISQMYIPTAGSSMGILSSDFTRPMRDESMRSMQQQLGIVYDYSAITFVGLSTSGSYATPTVFKDFYQQRVAAEQAVEAAKQTQQELQDRLMAMKSSDEGYADAKQQWKDSSTAWRLATDALYAVDNQKMRNEYVNQQLSALGYQPSEIDHQSSDHRWWVRLKDIGTIAPADYRKTGRLLVMTAQEPIRIFDYAGNAEGDLMDLDYKKIGMFRKVEEMGYDGVRITDFAQSASEGNYGHISFGIFPDHVGKFSISEIPGVKHPTGEDVSRFHQTRNFHSPEYLAHLSRNKK